MRMMMMRRRLEFSSGLSRRWLISAIVPRSNWNLENVGLSGGGKTGGLGEKTSEQGQGPTKNSTHMWYQVQESNPSHSERSLATAPHRFPNLCIFLFQFICTSLVFNIFNLLNSFICFFCFCFCFNLLSCNKINVEVLVEKITSCFRRNSRAQLLFFNFQFLASIKCLKSYNFT